jgi:polysaccharide pyruvyl transferase WcaK-like protein
MSRLNDQDRKAITFDEEKLREEPPELTIQSEHAHTKKHITFFGGFGLGNFGNEITFQAILYQLRHRLPNAEFNCICTHPEVTSANYNIKAVPISRSVINVWRPKNRVATVLRSFFIGIPSELYRWFEALMTLKHSDVFIIPGTGLLTDAYGLTSWGPYKIFKWSLLAKIRGCKLLFVSVGAGPLHSQIGKWLVKSALALADFRSYRDNETKAFLRSYGAGRETDEVFPDLAFSIVDKLRPTVANPNRRRPVVGLGLMLYHGRLSSDQDRESTYKAYLEQLAVLAKWLLTRGYDIRLLIGELSDISVTEDLKALLRTRLEIYDEERIIDEPASSVEDLLAQLSKTDAVVATRFHNILLALALNKPAICVSFHQKCTSLMQDMGLQEYCQDIKQLNAEKLIEQFCKLEANAVSLKAMIRQRVSDCRKALDEQYDLIFEKISAR